MEGRSDEGRERERKNKNKERKEGVDGMRKEFPVMITRGETVPNHKQPYRFAIMF